MALFTVDADGAPLGIAATATSDAAVDLVRRLCRAQELALADKNAAYRLLRLSVRASTPSEEELFHRAGVSGGVRLAGILIAGG
jgi:hypothetical protein